MSKIEVDDLQTAKAQLPIGVDDAVGKRIELRWKGITGIWRKFGVVFDPEYPILSGVEIDKKNGRLDIHVALSVHDVEDLRTVLSLAFNVETNDIVFVDATR